MRFLGAFSLLMLQAICIPALTIAAPEEPTRNEIREGMIRVTGGRVWYRIVGADRKGTPLLALHGGPGAGSAAFETLEILSDERPFIVYDQLGCGRSDWPKDTSLYTTDRFVEELAQVRAALKLDRVHILGHSWGSMLAVDYMLTKPKGVDSLVLAGPCLSAKRWAEDQKAYLLQMPKEMQDTIAKHEKAGTTDSPEYQAAVMKYYEVHLCRVLPWPQVMQRAMTGFSVPVYGYMWGPSEFAVTGTLKTYERVDRLGEIKTPVLFTCGEFDEATPKATALYQSKIPGAKMTVIENASHMTYVEQPEKYAAVIRDFIHSVEKH